MSLARHTGWSANRDLRQFFDRFLNAEEGDQSNVVTSQWAPRVDIREEDKRFVILADVPGVDPAAIEVHMDKGILTIKGESTSEKVEGTKFTRIERSYGSF
ncbi:MAG TPA: Hsp20/alpha crystallin family protein, partial [Dokdonella sp.]|nr:Hsp20/alpha crystallin family protein [Dokdonella sp.]